MDINEKWTFRDLVYNIKNIRHEFERGLCLFKCYEVKERSDYIQEFRNKIFSLKMGYGQKERCWEYINHDEIYKTLKEEVEKSKHLK